MNNETKKLLFPHTNEFQNVNIISDYIKMTPHSIDKTIPIL